MKNIALIFLFLYPVFAHSQNIGLVAGGGSGSDGSAAISASIYDPCGLVFDRHGDLYFCEELGHKVRKIDNFGIISTIAGTGIAGYYGDNGVSTAAKLNQPAGITIDSVGNLYIADIANHAVRRINALTGIITTICGNGTAGFAGDGGPASAAILNSPADVKFDFYGNLYIACLGSIRRISTSGVISTVAGIGISYGNTGDGGPATSAHIQPCNLCIDKSGNIYMTDNQHWVIRKITLSTGVIDYVAGNFSSYIFNGDDIPATSAHFDPEGLAIDENGRLFIGDRANNRVRMIDKAGVIHTIAGNGISASTGDGGAATASQTYWPTYLTFDSCFNLIFSQIGIQRIRKITFNPAPCPYLVVKPVSAQSVSIYPNPATDELHIDVITNVEYVLLNITGIIEQSGKLKAGENTIWLQSLSPCLHLLELVDDEGNRTVRKIIKQ